MEIETAPSRLESMEILLNTLEYIPPSYLRCRLRRTSKYFHKLLSDGSKLKGSPILKRALFLDEANQDQRLRTTNIHWHPIFSKIKGNVLTLRDLVVEHEDGQQSKFTETSAMNGNAFSLDIPSHMTILAGMPVGASVYVRDRPGISSPARSKLYTFLEVVLGYLHRQFDIRSDLLKKQESELTLDDEEMERLRAVNELLEYISLKKYMWQGIETVWVDHKTGLIHVPVNDFDIDTTST